MLVLRVLIGKWPRNLSPSASERSRFCSRTVLPLFHWADACATAGRRQSVDQVGTFQVRLGEQRIQAFDVRPDGGWAGFLVKLAISFANTRILYLRLATSLSKSGGAGAGSVVS